MNQVYGGDWIAYFNIGFVALIVLCALFVTLYVFDASRKNSELIRLLKSIDSKLDRLIDDDHGES